jgi:hypothetical protein
MTENEFLVELYNAIDPAEEIELSLEIDLKEYEFFDSLAQLGIIVMFETLANKTLTAEALAERTRVRDLYQLFLEQ